MNKEFKLCKTCLTNITNNDYCNACGHTFDPKETAIFITKGNFPRHFVWYGLLASAIFGFMFYFVLHAFFAGAFAMKQMAASLFFVVPLSCGATLAYFIRPIQNIFRRALISFLIAVIFGALVYVSNVSGLPYVKGLAAIFVAPLYVGVLFGRLFRLWSARHLTTRSQSSSLLLVFLLVIIYHETS